MRTTNVSVACALLSVLLGVVTGCGSSDSQDGATAGSGANEQAGAGASATAGSSGSSGSGGNSTGTAGSSTAGSMAASAGSSAAGSTAATAGSSAAGSMAVMDAGVDTGADDAGGVSGPLPSFDEATAMVEDYGAAHPGQAGDVVSKTPAEIAADPDAQQLLALCGDDERPVIPALAWEYGGGSHGWINPEMSALVYCVYIPVSPDTDYWQYDPGADHVTADVYLPYPDDNPCEAESGAAQVSNCIGDASNFEILVDTASLNDGHDVGLELSEASTELELILPDQSTVHLFDGL